MRFDLPVKAFLEFGLYYNRMRVNLAPRRTGIFYPWPQLMARIFQIDVLACPRCGAKRRILAAIDAPEAIRKILSFLGLPTRAPPVTPALPDTDEAGLW